jgi:hypothetical protein
MGGRPDELIHNHGVIMAEFSGFSKNRVQFFKDLGKNNTNYKNMAPIHRWSKKVLEE